MVKTHSDSRMRIMTLAEIRDSRDVILQTENTESKFKDGQEVYLCEVVSSYAYDKKPTVDKLSAELIRVNEENRSLRRKLQRAEKIVKETKSYMPFIRRPR